MGILIGQQQKLMQELNPCGIDSAGVKMITASSVLRMVSNISR